MWQRENKNHRIQKFAILDTKFVNIREASFACCKRKTKITKFRDVVSKIRDQHVGPAHFLYNNVNRQFQRYCFQSSLICSEPLKPSVQLKRAQISQYLSKKSQKRTAKS